MILFYADMWVEILEDSPYGHYEVYRGHRYISVRSVIGGQHYLALMKNIKIVPVPF